VWTLSGRELGQAPAEDVGLFFGLGKAEFELLDLGQQPGAGIACFPDLSQGQAKGQVSPSAASSRTLSAVTSSRLRRARLKVTRSWMGLEAALLVLVAEVAPSQYGRRPV